MRLGTAHDRRDAPGAVLVVGSRAAARRVGDAGARRAVVGAMIAVPYAIALGVVNLFVTLRLEPGGAFLASPTSIAVPAWEGFVLPAALAVVVGALGGWSVSRSWRGSAGRVAAAGLRTFAWALGLAPRGLARLRRAATGGPGALRDRGVVGAARHGPRSTSDIRRCCCPTRRSGSSHRRWAGASRSGTTRPRATSSVSTGSRAAPIPPPGSSPSSGGSRDDRRRRPPPWPRGSSSFVPAAAIVLGVRSLGPVASSWRSAIAMGAAGGAVFALAVTVVSLAASLWLSSEGRRRGSSRRARSRSGDDGALALAWGVVGGAAVSVASSAVQPPRLTSVKFDSICVNRPHAAAHPASSRGNFSTGGRGRLAVPDAEERATVAEQVPGARVGVLHRRDVVGIHRRPGRRASPTTTTRLPVRPRSCWARGPRIAARPGASRRRCVGTAPRAVRATGGPRCRTRRPSSPTRTGTRSACSERRRRLGLGGGATVSDAAAAPDALRGSRSGRRRRPRASGTSLRRPGSGEAAGGDASTGEATNRARPSGRCGSTGT